MAEPSQYESLLAVVLLEHAVASVLAGPVLAGLHLAEELIGATSLVSAVPGLPFLDLTDTISFSFLDSGKSLQISLVSLILSFLSSSGSPLVSSSQTSQ